MIYVTLSVHVILRVQNIVIVTLWPSINEEKHHMSLHTVSYWPAPSNYITDNKLSEKNFLEF